jgi:hypothetical protein
MLFGCYLKTKDSTSKTADEITLRTQITPIITDLNKKSNRAKYLPKEIQQLIQQTKYFLKTSGATIK